MSHRRTRWLPPVEVGITVLLVVAALAGSASAAPAPARADASALMIELAPWRTTIERLERLDARGITTRLVEEHLAPPPPLDWRELTLTAAIAALALVLSMSTIVVWNWQLRKTVARRTDQLERAVHQLEESVRARDAALGALGSSEERYRSVIDNMLGGLITTDESGRIELVNPAAARMFGYSPAALEGQPLTILAPAEDPEEARAFLKAAFHQAFDRVTEWEGRRRDGSVIPFELSLFAFDGPSGRRFAGNLVDISERRQVDRMKNEFVSVVSHELRTPLTAMKASMQLLLDAGVLDEDHQTLIRVALNNTQRLIRIINDMLDVAKIEAGRFELRIQPCEVGILVDQAVLNVAPLARDHEVEIVREVEHGVPRLDADPDRIVQMLVNLLSNALKFAPHGSAVAVGATTDGPGVRLWVRDHGRGIPEDQLPRLFQKFQQLDSSDSRRIPGTGLGLVITKAIAEQHGGTVSVSSRAGEGTTFSIFLPIGVHVAA